MQSPIETLLLLLLLLLRLLLILPLLLLLPPLLLVLLDYTGVLLNRVHICHYRIQQVCNDTTALCALITWSQPFFLRNPPFPYSYPRRLT